MKRTCFIYVLLIAMLTASVSIAEQINMPGIDGSQAYDIIISLKELGIPQPDTKSIDGGFQWTSENATMGTTSIMYDITANENHEICTATFNMRGSDNGFLSWVGSLPYDSADTEKTQSFISSHLTGEDASLIVGDALWEIFPYEDGEGAMLRLSDVESAAYYDALLNAVLGL